MSFNQNYAKYGLLIGLASISVELVIGVGGFFGAVFLGIGISNLQKNIRREQDDELSYGKGLFVGFVLSLISGTVIAIYTYVDLYLNPQILNEIVDTAAYVLEDMNIEGELFEQVMGFYEVYLTPFWMGISAIFGQLFVGFILSLIITIFTYKSPNRFRID